MIRLAINGVAGRMGTKILSLAHNDPRFKVVAGLEPPASKLLGTDLGELARIDKLGVCVSAEPASAVDVMIDFSSPQGTLSALDYCTRHKTPLVICTTGLGALHNERIAAAVKEIAVLRSANMSVGVNVLLRIVTEVAQALGKEYDCEIAETHHRFKADAPSGTALALLDAVLEATHRNRAEHVIYGRQGQTGPRPAGQIAVHALRLGDTVGEHSVSFGSLGETITISHSAHTRDIFATGALRAAAWIAGKPARLYSMKDVLFG